MFANDFKWSCWLIGRSPEEGNGLLLQHSCLENPKDRGAWRATVHSVTKSRIGLKWFSLHSDELKNTESQIVRIDYKRKIKLTICQQNTVFLGVNCKAPTEILLLFSFGELVGVSVKAECSMIDTIASSLIYVFKTGTSKADFLALTWSQDGYMMPPTRSQHVGDHIIGLKCQGHGNEKSAEEVAERAVTDSRGTGQGFLEEVNRWGLGRTWRGRR